MPLTKQKLLEGKEATENLDIERTKELLEEKMYSWYSGAKLSVRALSDSPRVVEEVLAIYPDWTYEGGVDGGVFIFE